MDLTHVKSDRCESCESQEKCRTHLPGGLCHGALYCASSDPPPIGDQAPLHSDLYPADGTEIRRRMGDAIFLFNGRRGASPVIFGEKGDGTLLGTVSLESLVLILDPIKRILKPLPMILA